VNLRRIVLGCGLLLLGAVASNGWRAGAQDDSAAAPRSVVRTVAKATVASGVALDPQGGLDYAAMNRIARTIPAPSGNAVPLIAVGNGQRGSLGDGGPATSAQLDLAAATVKNAGAGSGIAIDPAGNIFIADTLNDTIRRVDAETGVISSVAGKWATVVTPAGFEKPAGVATDNGGNIYVTANNAVYRVDARTGAVTQIANVAGAASIAVTRDGATIYVVSAPSGSIFTISGTSLTANGASALSMFATARDAHNFSSQAKSAHVLTAAPSGIALDPHGEVFVSEASANIIEHLYLDHFGAARVARVAGTGAAGNSGDGGAPLAAQFRTPGALAFDRDGNLFVSDVGNSAIREITNVSPAASANVTLTPNTFSFGDQLSGGTSAAQTFTLSNNSANSVTNIGVQFVGGATPADFTQTNSCSGGLAAGASCAINVTFTPQASGQRAATLYVTDSDPTSPQTAALSGTGDDFTLAIPLNGPMEVTVLAGETATFQIQAAPDTAFSGTVALNCPYNLPLQTTCTITTNPATTPPTLTLTPGTGAQTYSVAFKTTIRSSTTGPGITSVGPMGKASGGSKPRFPSGPAAGIAIGLMALLAAALFVAARDASRRWLLKSAVPALLIGILLAIAPGCGSNTSGTYTQTIYTGTPAGTYLMMVTATAQGATRSVNIVLIVQ
jgi:hypothetical protein